LPELGCDLLEMGVLVGCSFVVTAVNLKETVIYT